MNLFRFARRLVLLISIVVGLAVFAPPAFTQEEGDKAPEEKKAKEEHKKHSPLEEQMEGMNKAYKQLSAGLKNPQDSEKENYLKLVDTMKTTATKARDLVPSKAQGLSDEKQKEMVESYKKAIDELLKTIDGLGQAIKDGKWDDAKKAIVTMKNAKTKGHRSFIKEE